MAVSEQLTTTANGQPGESQEKPTTTAAATLIVGTFRSPALYTLALASSAANTATTTNNKPASLSSSSCSLTVAHKSAAVGGHSWLGLSPSKARLYATCWTSPPSVAAYAVQPGDHSVRLLNTAPVASLSGYVAVTPSGRHLLSVGGPTGEVFRLLPREGGKIGPLVQTLNFRQEGGADDGKRDGVAHGGFGGLRWGAHSVDVAPDGASAYVADIGHNCIWTYHLHEEEEEDDDEGDDEPQPKPPQEDKENGSNGEETTKQNGKGKKPVLTLGTKHISPRSHDGPRHAWPHPSGRVLYVVQEHSSMVDAFSIADDTTTTLAHVGGYTILPGDQTCDDFWADEVRTSHLFVHPPSSTSTKANANAPRYLYASTRGLRPETKGYVVAYALGPEGHLAGPALAIYETRTSGGLANAVEPAPAEVSRRLLGGDKQEELIALTDSEEGWVVILGWDGRRFREVAATRLGSEEEGDDDGQAREVVQAATAVWL